MIRQNLCPKGRLQVFRACMDEFSIPSLNLSPDLYIQWCIWNLNSNIQKASLNLYLKNAMATLTPSPQTCSSQSPAHAKWKLSQSSGSGAWYLSFSHFPHPLSASGCFSLQNIPWICSRLTSSIIASLHGATISSLLPSTCPSTSVSGSVSHHPTSCSPSSTEMSF